MPTNRLIWKSAWITCAFAEQPWLQEISSQQSSRWQSRRAQQACNQIAIQEYESQFNFTHCFQLSQSLTRVQYFMCKCTPPLVLLTPTEWALWLSEDVRSSRARLWGAITSPAPPVRCHGNQRNLDLNSSTPEHPHQPRTMLWLEENKSWWRSSLPPHCPFI